MEVRAIAVLGAGTMGSGIAQVAAQAGLDVKMRDMNDELLEAGMTNIEQSLGRMLKKERITQDDMDAALARVTCTTNLTDAVKDVNVVIEAIPEDMALKIETFKAIDNVASSDAVFASNTSGLSITEMASSTSRPDRFIGMHFFNPVPMMELVEIVTGYSTSGETLDTVQTLSARMGKTTVVAKDTPGFITTRFICVLQNEAIHAWAEGIASAEDIDKAMKLGMNHPMGPLQLADFIGLDTLLHVMDNLASEYGDPKYRPPLVLRKMVRAGHLGRKTGRGIYDYSHD